MYVYNRVEETSYICNKEFYRSLEVCIYKMMRPSHKHVDVSANDGEVFMCIELL